MDAPQTEWEKSQNITRRPRVRDPPHRVTSFCIAAKFHLQYQAETGKISLSHSAFSAEASIRRGGIGASSFFSHPSFFSIKEINFL